MGITRETYESLLREHLRRCRQLRPIPPVESLSALEKAQYKIIGGHLIQWLRDWGPRLLHERATLERIFGREVTQPLICFHTSVPGLVAAYQILGEEHPRVVYGLREDFAEFPVADKEYWYHVELFSYFRPASAEELGNAVVAKYPLRPNEEYWIHCEGTMLGDLFGRGCDHLWKWDGSQMTLLEEGFTCWIS